MVRLSLLGPLHISLHGEPVAGFKSTKIQALFCYLALTKQPHTRHALAGLFWSDDREDNAKNSLRVALNNLNALFADYLEISRLTVAFKADAPHWIDVEAFTELTQSLATDTLFPDMEALQAAAALYRGELLADVRVDGALAFIEWLTAARLRYRQTARALFDALATALLEQHAHGEAAHALEQLVRLDPNLEDAHRQLMITYGRLGKYDAALAQYETCRRVLDEALGVQPMPETVALYARIRDAQAQRVETRPVVQDRFVGRTVELQQLQNMLFNPACRLITITGFGGMGKTRLAAAAVHHINAEQTLFFLNGVVFVPLASVAAADLLPNALAAAINLTLAGKADPAAQLLDYLQNKEMLLVLDNFEHLADGIGLISDILRSCPDVKLVVTSREPLYIEAEWRLHLEGLSYPIAADKQDERPAGELAPAQLVRTAQQYEAVRLLLQTAHEVDERYTLAGANVAAICRLCELAAGSPLAIKLATHWLRTMSMERIVQEVERSIDLLTTDAPDWPQRQRSMRAILDYTYRLLSAQEQYVVRDISIFRGGFTEEAAAEVADAQPYVLAGLIDRGLLQLRMSPEGTRYEIHELTRQYVAEKLNKAGHAALHGAHSQFYARLVQRQAQPIRERAYRTAIAAITADLDNIRAAWRWLLGCLQRGETVSFVLDAFAKFTPTMADYFHSVAAMQPAKQFFGPAVAAVQAGSYANEEAGVPEQARQKQQTVLAQLQVRLAWFHLELGEYEDVDRLGAAALPTLQSAECTADIALLMTILGRANIRRGLLDAAATQLREGIELYAALGDVHGQAYAMRSDGIRLSATGDYAGARAVYAEARALCEAIGYTRGTAQILANVGTTFAREDNYSQALPLYQESLAMAAAEADRQMLMVSLSNVGSAQWGVGNHALAETFTKRSLSMARALGNRRWIAADLQILSQIYVETYDLTAALHSAQEGIQVAHEIGSAPDALGCLSTLAHAWAYRGEVEEALRALFFVEHHPSAMARDKRYNAQLLEELRQELPPALVADAEAWSRQQSLEDVIGWITERSAPRATLRDQVEQEGVRG